MAGVNRAAVAVTDTFDVWRVRTNELNTSLNAGTHAKTADTIVWRDDDASFVANVVTANTLTMTHETGTATLVVSSALAADATKASIQTTGGIKADLGSKFGAAVDVTGNLTVGGNATLGNVNASDTITLTGRINTVLDTATSITYDIGTSGRKWKTYYGQGINLAGNTTFAAAATLDIAAGHATKPSLKITDAVQAGTSAQLINVTSNSADTAARDLALIHNDNALAVGATALHLKSDGGRGLQITSTLAAGKPSLEITSSHTTANSAIVTASALTTGSAVQVTSAGASRTGHLVHLASTNTGAGSTGDVLHVKAHTSSNTAMIANFANATTNVLSVMVGGGVKIDGDLDVTGSTTQLRTTSAVVNDKTLVLGAVGDAVTGVIFSQHADTPVFTTTATHGLSVDDVIFVVTSTSSVVASEQILTLASVPSTTTFTVDGSQNTSSDGSTRTISYTGPQLDSGVDDAGLYVPGSTALHTMKWDDTDNYWEFNDSLKVDTTTQLVVPRGTTAQQPAASATATVAAAITGAMRFNTENSYFEGVNAGTTFEAFATQNFSTAIAVALG
jgi:hypothetical protein